MEFILITGATSSMGSSIAKALSARYILILGGRNIEELNILKSKLDGDHHYIWPCDFMVNDVAENLNTFLEKNDLKPHHFLHIGGWFSIAPIRLQKKLDTQKSFQINVFSAIEIISVLSKKAYKKELKNILFFSSISSIQGQAGYAVYAAAKSALLGLMKSLAIELKPTKVNTIVLGAVKTKATLAIIQNNEAALNHEIPLGIAEENVLNDWITFLLKGKTWMTGQKIIIDGGATV